MTPREAYDRDDTFRALINVWVQERRCPLVLAERAQELGMAESVKLCAEWAAAEPERPVQSYSEPSDTTTGPAPACAWHPSNTTYKYGTRGSYFWCHDELNNPSCHIPRGKVRDLNKDNIYFEMPLDAILWLLDNWIPA